VTEQHTRAFHLGDVLSLTTGRLVSPRSLEGLYELLFYLTGSEPAADDLEAVSQVCRRYLVAAMPTFVDIDGGVIDADNWRKWLDQQVRQYGQFVEVRRPAPGELRLP
jgi:hypothetical protein